MSFIRPLHGKVVLEGHQINTSRSHDLLYSPSEETVSLWANLYLWADIAHQELPAEEDAQHSSHLYHKLYEKLKQELYRIAPQAETVSLRLMRKRQEREGRKTEKRDREKKERENKIKLQEADDTRIILELCFALHHQLCPNIWDPEFMGQALVLSYPINSKANLPKNFPEFVQDCFNAGGGPAVGLFNHHLHSYFWLDTHSNDCWTIAIRLLACYYVALAHSWEDVTKRLTSDFRSVAGKDLLEGAGSGNTRFQVLLAVVEGIFQHLRRRWSTSFQTPNQADTPENDTTNLNLAANFENILALYGEQGDDVLWERTFNSIAVITLSNPLPLSHKVQFEKMFNFIEEKKRTHLDNNPYRSKVKEYDLYVHEPSSE